MGELYLIDKDGFRYGFNADMAKHTNLYAVMRDGVRVPWTGSPPVQGGPASTVVLAEDKFPTEAELLQAKTMVAQRNADQQAEQVVMAAQAVQADQGATVPVQPRMPRPQPSVEGNETEAADLVVAGKTEPPSQVGGTPVSDYQADAEVRMPTAIPAAPPLPPRRAAPRPPIRP